MTPTRGIAIMSTLLALGLVPGCGGEGARVDGPSGNQATVDTYMEGFRRGDHAMVLGCLTDDVVWDIPGAFRLTGKAEFDKHILDDAFVGKPTITVTRTTEQDGVVVAEGAVSCARKDGGVLNARFCDVFELRDGRIRKLTSYLAMTNP
jgi:ketosteroid isomerase-like protein